jgi:hypothetical protein
LRDLFKVSNTKDIEFGEFFKKVSENNDEIESVRDIGVGLLKVFNTNNNDE